MREKWARQIALLAGGLVCVLAVVFAYHQNPPHSEPVPAPGAPPVVTMAPPPVTPSVTPSALIQAGQEVYIERACARCHSIGGRGSERSALDGVGARLSEADIRSWLTPSAGATGFQARHANVDLTPAQRDALVAYLRSLQ